MHKTDKRKAPRNHRLPVLGQVDARNTAVGREPLQVRLGRLLRDVRHAQRRLVAIIVLGHRSRAPTPNRPRPPRPGPACWGTYDVRIPGAGAGASSPGGGMLPPSPSTPYFCWSLRHICFLANSFIEEAAAFCCVSFCAFFFQGHSFVVVGDDGHVAIVLFLAGDAEAVGAESLHSARHRLALAGLDFLTKISFVVFCFCSAAFSTIPSLKPLSLTAVSVRAGRASSSSSSSPQAILVCVARAALNELAQRVRTVLRLLAATTSSWHASWATKAREVARAGRPSIFLR